MGLDENSLKNLEILKNLHDNTSLILYSASLTTQKPQWAAEHLKDGLHRLNR